MTDSPPRAVPLWAVALGGVLTALAFPLQPVPMAPPFAVWPLVFLGPAPFLARLLLADSMRQAALAAFAFVGAWTLLAGVWAFRMFDALGWVLVWLPIASVVAFGVLADLVRRARFDVAWSWPLLWVAVEYTRSEATPLRLDWLSATLDPLNFTWFGLGHPRVAAPAWAQSADLFGGYGLGVAPFLTSLVLALAWVNRRLPMRLAAVTGVLLAAEFAYGTWRLSRPPAGPLVAVGVVQSERFELPVLMGLTEQLLARHPQTEVVVWPEESFTPRAGDRDRLLEFARQRKVTLAVGVESIQADGTHRNVAWWLPPDGPTGEYAKQQRVPFVETHQASRECRTFERGGVQFGILICYDVDAPANPRRLVFECGANVILMPTLDEITWGGTQHAQHALMPRLRAIENRRPFVQAATSGYSQIIDDRGRVLAEVPFRLNTRPDRPTPYREGFAAGVVHARSDLSVYTRWGHFVAPAATVMALFTTALALLRLRRL
jgi:apolipoprotein N-acyltransferase